jgi:hypothetical protein
MTTTVAAPAADVSGASSSTTSSKPVSTGRPTRADIASRLAGNAESDPAEPAGTAVAPQSDGAPGVDAADKTPGDSTAPLEAGKGDDKPDEKKEPERSIPERAFKERLAREKEKREKLSADLNAAQLEASKIRSLFEVAVAENERLTEQLRSGKGYDERGEELQSLKIQQSAREMLARKEKEHQAALEKAREESRSEALGIEAAAIAERWRAEIAEVEQVYPLVGAAEIKAELRKNPHAEVREIARAIQEKRMALMAKQNPNAAAQNLPSTVAKPTGAARFQYELSKKGIAAHLAASAAKG